MMALSPELRLVLAAFALFRLAELFAIDEGPGEVFLRLRIVLGVYDRTENGRARTGLGRLFGCPYCLGVWCALPVLALVLVPTGLGDVVLLWLALCGMQALLQTVGGRT